MEHVAVYLYFAIYNLVALEFAIFRTFSVTHSDCGLCGNAVKMMVVVVVGIELDFVLAKEVNGPEMELCLTTEKQRNREKQQQTTKKYLPFDTFV